MDVSAETANNRLVWVVRKIGLAGGVSDTKATALDELAGEIVIAGAAVGSAEGSF